MFLQNTVQSTVLQHPSKSLTLIDCVEVQMGSHVAEAGETIIPHLPRILILRYGIAYTKIRNQALHCSLMGLQNWPVNIRQEVPQHLLVLLIAHINKVEQFSLFHVTCLLSIVFIVDVVC